MVNGEEIDNWITVVGLRYRKEVERMEADGKLYKSKDKKVQEEK